MTQIQNRWFTVFCLPKTMLQQKTQTPYPFWVQGSPRRNFASSRESDANLWRCSGGSIGVGHGQAERSMPKRTVASTEGERRGVSPSSGGRPPRLLLEESTLVTRATMEVELLRSPPILHASESSIGEWKALEMENAVVWHAWFDSWIWRWDLGEEEEGCFSVSFWGRENARLRNRQAEGERERWVFEWAVGEHQFWGCDLFTLYDPY